MANAPKHRSTITPLAPTTTRAKRKRTNDDDGVPPPTGPPPAGVNGTTGHAAKRQAVDKNGAREAAAREAARHAREREAREAEERREEMRKKLVVDFNTFTLPELHKYIALHSLVPVIYPSPLLDQPPPPTHLLLHPPPVPQPEPTAANRPQRASRRLLQNAQARAPLGPKDTREPCMYDLEGYKKALAAVCERHANGVGALKLKDAEVTMAFMYAIKVKDRSLKVLPLDKAPL